MLFKLLKLFGLDIPAKVAAAKSAIEQRAEEVADFAKEATQTAAVIAVLSVLAGISGAMALGVGLLEVYRVVAESYGVNTGLGVIAAVFVAVAVILLLIAWAKEQSLSNRRIFKPLTPFPAATSDSSAPVVAEVQASASPAADGPRLEPAQDLFEPLAYLLAKYIRYLRGKPADYGTRSRRRGGGEGRKSRALRQSGPAARLAGRRRVCRVVARAAK